MDFEVIDKIEDWQIKEDYEILPFLSDKTVYSEYIKTERVFNALKESYTTISEAIEDYKVFIDVLRRHEKLGGILNNFNDGRSNIK